MRLTALTTIALFAFAACSAKSKDTAPDDPKPAIVAPVAPAATSLETAYEAVRAALAGDDFGAAKAAAAGLAKFAGADEAIAKGAHDIGTAADIEVARLAFGDASRAYITLLSQDPERAKGKYAFRCPMAKGYKLWVQLTDKLENPYMGQRMIDCGSPVAMAP